MWTEGISQHHPWTRFFLCLCLLRIHFMGCTQYLFFLRFCAARINKLKKKWFLRNSGFDISADIEPDKVTVSFSQFTSLKSLHLVWMATATLGAANKIKFLNCLLWRQQPIPLKWRINLIKFTRHMSNGNSKIHTHLMVLHSRHVHSTQCIASRNV